MDRIAEAGVEERLFLRTNTQTRGFEWLLIVAANLFFGVAVFWSRESWLLFYFVPAAYGAIFYSWLKAFHAWRDPLNPLCLILTVASVRFFLPGMLVLGGAEAADENGLFRLMKLTDSDWQWGHALALLGMLAVALGWLLIPAQRISRQSLKVDLDAGVKYASIVGMVVGFAALLLFFVMNASLGAIFSGAFRGVVIQEGTGKYFFTAYLLIVGSILLCCHLLNKGFTGIALVPVGLCMISFWPLGGRGRALMSVAGGLMLLWYRFRERGEWKKLSIQPRHMLTVALIGILMITVSYLGAVYRADANEHTSKEPSISGLWKYSKTAIYTDIGQLHSLAGAMAIGPAVLHGQSFIGSLSWPLSKIFPLPSRNAGVFLVDELIGFTDGRVWALNSSLVGDAYLNFGLWGVMAVMGLYGALLKILYMKFRHGVIHSVIYALATLYAVNMIWVSIEVWPHALTVLVFVFILIWLGENILNLRGASAFGRSNVIAN